MAGGHVDAANGLLEANGMGDYWRWGIAFAEPRDQAVGLGHFGGGETKFLT